MTYVAIVLRKLKELIMDIEDLARREFKRLRELGYTAEWALDKACEFAYDTDDLDSVDEDELCNLKAFLSLNDTVVD
jgi:hypothetical protein